MATKTFKIGLSNTDKQNMAQDVYERVLDLTFAEYDSTKTYNTGDFVVYNDALYKCKEDSVTGTWDSSKWQSATLQDLLDDVEGAVASVSGKANTIDLQNGTLVPAKSLVAEQIENVSEDSGTVQDKPFTFQATATDGGTGASDTAPTAKYLKLKGKTYAMNQLVNNGNFASASGWSIITGSSLSVSNNIASVVLDGTQTATFGGIKRYIDLIDTHKVLIKVDMWVDDTAYNNDVRGSVGLNGKSAQSLTNLSLTKTRTTYCIIKEIILGGSGVNLNAGGYGTETKTGTIYIANLQVFDLTKLFNGDIPDAILNGVELEDYNLTFNGVDIFNQLFPLPYYAYNAGSLVSANATKLTTLGKNQFGGSLVGGDINTTTGEDGSGSNAFKTQGYIRVIPKQKYNVNYNRDALGGTQYLLEYDENKNYIGLSGGQGYGAATHTYELSSNTHYVRILFYKSGSNWYSNVPTKEQTKLQVYIAWDETRPEYEEYVKHEYALGSELEEHPLLSAGNVCDEKTPDGTITRKIGFKDLSTITNWYYDSGNGTWSSNQLSGTFNADDSLAFNVVSDKYTPIRFNGIYTSTDNNLIAFRSNGYIYVKNGSSTTEPSGNIVYELDTPTEEQGDSFPEVIEVDDFGTMEYGGTNYNGYPQGCEFFYPADYVLFIDTLGNSVDWEAGNIATKNDLKYHELDSANIGEITTTTITTGFYKNSIAITSGLSTAIDVRVQMSNGAIYPAILNGATELVIFNGTNFQTAGTTVVKVYWKN